MYKLIKIYTHGVAEVTGTQIFVTSELNKSKESVGIIALFVYNERGVIEHIYAPFNSELRKHIEAA